jgi:hypothetical protein
MQTLANLSSSREVLRQVDVNMATLARFELYYASFLDVCILKYIWQFISSSLRCTETETMSFIIIFLTDISLGYRRCNFS